MTPGTPVADAYIYIEASDLWSNASEIIYAVSDHACGSYNTSMGLLCDGCFLYVGVLC